MFDGRSKKNGFDAIKPRSLGHDLRFKSYPYIPNSVYEMTVLYDNPTYLEFAPDEDITTIVSSKKDSWQLVPQHNKLYIKPIESDADMHLTIMTTKRKYFFEMYAREPMGQFDKDYAFFYQFKYPTENQGTSIKRYAKSVLPDVDQNPEKYNFYYTIVGERSLYPIKIFDDGEFTYFEFPRNSRIPAVFSVDSNGFESLINYRMVGDYLVAEEVSSRFTLRNGPDVVCVYNEAEYKKIFSENERMYAKSAVPISPSVPPARKAVGVDTRVLQKSPEQNGKWGLFDLFRRNGAKPDRVDLLASGNRPVGNDLRDTSSVSRASTSYDKPSFRPVGVGPASRSESVIYSRGSRPGN